MLGIKVGFVRQLYVNYTQGEDSYKQDDKNTYVLTWKIRYDVKITVIEMKIIKVDILGGIQGSLR